MQKKVYTRMERIRYYCLIIDRNFGKTDDEAIRAIEIALNRLDHLTSSTYVDKVEQERFTKKIKDIAASKTLEEKK